MQEIEAHVLVVEDQHAMRQMLEDYLSSHSFRVTVAASADEVLAGLRQRDSDSTEAISVERLISRQNATTAGESSLDIDTFDAVLTDLKMPGTGGLELCRALHEFRATLPVIVMTAFGSLETAIEAIRAGAFDFVTKPVELELLLASLRRATETSRLRRQVQQLRDGSGDRFPELIGESEVMLRMKQQLTRIAESSATVLLTGESGSGKEVAARAIHHRSDRRDGPFVAINCAALPESLMESELFGHVKGAFTDARSDRDGLFVQADGGTLLLDEIGEMPLELQPKLLRALEAKAVRPVGGKQESPFDVRVLSATNRDLEHEVEKKRFRSDLFYRVNVLELPIPPLRQRGMDILLLANAFLREFARESRTEVNEISAAAGRKLLAYSWPGNVRELRNVIQRAVILATGTVLEDSDLPDKILDFNASELVIGASDHLSLVTLEQLEQRYIEYVLDYTGDNRTEAARILGVDRKTLYRKLRELEEAEND